MDIHLSTKNKSNTGVYPHCQNMPAYQYLINILWWSGGEKKIKITTAQCDLDLEQNTNEKSTTAIRTVFNCSICQLFCQTHFRELLHMEWRMSVVKYTYKNCGYFLPVPLINSRYMSHLTPEKRTKPSFKCLRFNV